MWVLLGLPLVSINNGLRIAKNLYPTCTYISELVYCMIADFL